MAAEAQIQNIIIYIQKNSVCDAYSVQIKNVHNTGHEVLCYFGFKRLISIYNIPWIELVASTSSVNKFSLAACDAKYHRSQLITR
ncbi:hypothetical protein GDO81_005681 [Engystomops pustulosus]|uniref:Uncharacterized protein n=1 Tax=Engystomops pustulosus TaxID=76066 RepID=A0AAV7CSE7_ENGPU|nr:hypothetical protein GDO81_005681 [Engystomops pustulosus]